MRSKLESRWKKKYATYVEQELNGFVVYLLKTNKDGIPDLLVMLKNKIFFLECKVNKNILSDRQKFVQQKIADYNIPVYTCYSFDQAIKITRLELCQNQS